MKALLDTSFILTCVKQKIDFIEELELLGVSMLIPKEVIVELKGLSKTRLEAQTALKILEKSKFSDIELKTKNVDNGIVKFANENTDILVATLDREIKSKTSNKKLIIRGKKKLEIL